MDAIIELRTMKLLFSSEIYIISFSSGVDLATICKVQARYPLSWAYSIFKTHPRWYFIKDFVKQKVYVRVIVNPYNPL